MDDFKANFKRIRLARGWSQYKCAKVMKFQAAAISHWELGRRAPNMTNLIRICEGLKCSPNDLLGWEKQTSTDIGGT